MKRKFAFSLTSLAFVGGLLAQSPDPSVVVAGGGIAIRPADMKLEDYARIVGVAWEASSNEVLNQVNTAVGINGNDIAGRVSQQQREIEALKAQMNQVMAYLQGQNKDLSLPPNEVASATSVATAPVPTASLAAQMKFILSIQLLLCACFSFAQTTCPPGFYESSPGRFLLSRRQ